MPYYYYCDVVKRQSNDDSDSDSDSETKLFYNTYGCGRVKVLLIIGLAATHEAWGPQIKYLTGTDQPNHDDHSNSDENGIHACAFDNRGVGLSSVPHSKSHYSTSIMAKDAIALMDHLGWNKAHIIGHSMGAMISCKLAAIVPHRVLSLSLLNVTGGGFQCLPKEYLEEYVGSTTRRSILYKQYVKAISATGMQTNYGLDGQINACWNHKVTRTEIEVIRSAGFLVSVIHGRHDIIAQIYHAKRLAEKLYPIARMIDLHGGHLVSHERTEEVNQALVELIKASKENLSPYDWTNLPNKSSGFFASGVSVGTVTGSKTSSLHIMQELHIFILYLFRILVLLFEYARKEFTKLESNSSLQEREVPKWHCLLIKWLVYCHKVKNYGRNFLVLISYTVASGESEEPDVLMVSDRKLSLQAL
ncbi:hypothetical protein ACFE04_008929 [Oxalis oulophora]